MARRWLAIVLAACGGSPGPAPAPAPAHAIAPPSCGAVYVRLVETGDEHAKARLMVAGEGLVPSAGKLSRLLSAAAAEACQADRWPDAAVRCLAGDDLLARARCLDALTEDQRAHLRARVDEAIATIPAVQVAREPRAWRDLPTQTGVPACDAYLVAINLLARCRTLPGIVRDQLAETAGAFAWVLVDLRPVGSDAPDPRTTSAGCADAATLAHQAATSYACAEHD